MPTRKRRTQDRPFDLDCFMHAIGLHPFTYDPGYQWWNAECEFYGLQGDMFVADIWGYDLVHAKADAERYHGEYVEMDGDPGHGGVHYQFPRPTTFDEAFECFVSMVS